MKEQIKKLATMLGMAGANGTAAIAAASGLFKPVNILLIAILFMAGPGAILVASMLEGGLRERLLVALFSGAIATLIVMFAAGFGPKLLDFVNLNVLKIVGGIAVLFIGFLIMGFKFSDKIPLVIIGAGLILGLLWR